MTLRVLVYHEYNFTNLQFLLDSCLSELSAHRENVFPKKLINSLSWSPPCEHTPPSLVRAHPLTQAEYVNALFLSVPDEFSSWTTYLLHTFVLDVPYRAAFASAGWTAAASRLQPRA